MPRLRIRSCGSTNIGICPGAGVSPKSPRGLIASGPPPPACDAGFLVGKGLGVPRIGVGDLLALGPEAGADVGVGRAFYRTRLRVGLKVEQLGAVADVVDAFSSGNSAP
jgi:hypothetical protein